LVEGSPGGQNPPGIEAGKICMVASWNTQALSHAPVNNLRDELCSVYSGPYSSDELHGKSS